MKGPDDAPAVPAWVEWLAQDADGTWWGFECEPNQSHNGWYENEIGRFIRLGAMQPPRDWRTTLRRAGAG